MSEFVSVAKVAELKEGSAKCVEVKGRLIALFLDQGQVHAIDDTCPHMGAPLSEGNLEGGVVTCSWHGWRFCIKDGSWADSPGSPGVGSYPAKVEGPDVLVEVNW